MNIAKNNYKNIPNSRINFLKYYIKLPLLKEEAKLLYQMKKQRFANKISVTELDLSKKESKLKQFNSKHNLFNNKILNQIQKISKKIYINNSPYKRHKMLDDILLSKPKNEINKNNNSNNAGVQNNYIKPSSLQKKSQIKYRNIKIKSKDNTVKENNSPLGKKYFHELKTEKEKIILPPIKQFKYNVQKIKLNVNNNMNKSEEEKMMKLFKELEFQNKNKFVI